MSQCLLCEVVELGAGTKAAKSVQLLWNDVS